MVMLQPNIILNHIIMIRKSMIEPNFSFDLCRLGCSIYDFLTEKYDTLDKIYIGQFTGIIMKWCDG